MRTEDRTNQKKFSTKLRSVDAPCNTQTCSILIIQPSFFFSFLFLSLSFLNGKWHIVAQSLLYRLIINAQRSLVKLMREERRHRDAKIYNRNSSSWQLLTISVRHQILWKQKAPDRHAPPSAILHIVSPHPHTPPPHLILSLLLANDLNNPIRQILWNAGIATSRWQIGGMPCLFPRKLSLPKQSHGILCGFDTNRKRDVLTLDGRFHYPTTDARMD